MEVKDWILLFAPIISNGLIVFFVQFFVTEKYKRAQDKKQLQNEMYKSLYNHIQSLMTGSMEIYIQNNKISELDKDIQQKNSAMEKLLIFCYSNQNTFKDMDFRINDIKDSWEKVYSLWLEYKEQMSKSETNLITNPNMYAELIDCIMLWKVSSELLRLHIISKL